MTARELATICRGERIKKRLGGLEGGSWISCLGPLRVSKPGAEQWAQIQPALLCAIEQLLGRYGS